MQVYTAEGREEIHRNLKFDETVMTVLHMLARAYMPNRSVEYMDNRVSLYAAQYGKCAVTGKVLWIDEIHCHHKKSISQGGKDDYNNLIIVHIDVHRLIHATKPETIQPKSWGDETADDDAPRAFKSKTKLSQHISFLRDFFQEL